MWLHGPSRLRAPHLGLNPRGTGTRGWGGWTAQAQWHHPSDRCGRKNAKDPPRRGGTGRQRDRPGGEDLEKIKRRDDCHGDQHQLSLTCGPVLWRRFSCSHCRSVMSDNLKIVSPGSGSKSPQMFPLSWAELSLHQDIPGYWKNGPSETELRPFSLQPKIKAEATFLHYFFLRPERGGEILLHRIPLDGMSTAARRNS